MQTSLDFSLSTDFKDVGSAKPERGHQPCESRVSYPCFTRHGGALFLPSGIRNLPEAEYEKRKRERNTESAARGKYRSAFFLSGKEYLHLAEGRKAAESDEKRQAAAMPFVVQKLRQRGHAAGDVHRRIQQTRQKNEATAPDARFPAAEVPLSARRGHAARGYFTFGVRPHA